MGTDVLPIFSDAQLEQVQCPVLFIGGKNDCFYNSEKSASRLMDNMKDVTTDVLPNTGHVLVNQTNTIIEFLRVKNEKT